MTTITRLVPLDPKLPADFDNTPNEARPQSHMRWWGKPYIVTETIDRLDRFYAERTDPYADAGRACWAIDRQKWLEAWPEGIRYNVRCLDGGAWDRSTSWGFFHTVEEAIACASGGLS
jgi:hypothetical protein